MPYLGDVVHNQSLYYSFTTVQSTGEPCTMVDGVVSIYRDDSATQTITGVTLTVDFDSMAGYNLIKIDTSASPSFYLALHDYHIVITAGTVNGVSLVGYRIGCFSIENRVSVDYAIRTAVGMATANLDAQLAAMKAEADNIAFIKNTTDQAVFTIPNQIDASLGGIGEGMVLP